MTKLKPIQQSELEVQAAGYWHEWHGREPLKVTR